MQLHSPYLSLGAKPVFNRGNHIGCLLLHGFSAAPPEISWLGDHLHRSLEMTTYTPRLTGHGTQPEDMRRMRWEDWYMSARDGYELLANQCDQVFVAGVSMGGLLTLLLAAAQDVNISGAALLATPSYYYSKAVANARWLKYLLSMNHMPDRTYLPQIIREEQYRREEHVIGRTHYTRWSLAAVEQLHQLTQTARTHFYQVRDPLLLIYAARDKAVPLECMDDIAHHVSSSSIEKHILHHSGHIITQDVERDTAFSLVEGFFRRHQK